MLVWATQRMKEIEQERKENAERREALKRRLRTQYGHKELRRIYLTEDEKQKLKTKIAEQKYKSETVSQQ